MNPISRNKRLRLEALEQKAMLAADVALSVVGGDLSILGDVDDDFIEMVSTTNANEYELTGSSGTTFSFDGDTGLSSVVVPGVTGNVTVDLGGGIDFYGLSNASLPGDLTFSSSDATDVFNVGNLGSLDPRVTIAGDLTYQVTSNNVSMVNIGVNVGGSVSLSGTPTDGSPVILQSMIISGGLEIALDADLTPINLTDIESVGGDVNVSGDQLDFRVNTSGPNNGITMEVAGDFNISGGAFDDVYVLDNIDVTGDFNLNVGDGANSVEVTQLSADDIRLTDGADSGSFVIDDISTVDDLRINAGDGGVEVQASTLNILDDMVFNGGTGDDIFFTEPNGDINSIGDDFYASGRGGNDEITLEDAAVGDKLRISTGSGDDIAFVVNATAGRSALVSLGSGTNEAEIEGLNAGRSLTVLGRGANTIAITDTNSTHFVTVVTSSGDDIVDLSGVTTSSALITTRAGADEVSITESEFDYLFVLLGSGDDTLTLQGVTVNRFAVLSGGSGTGDELVDDGDNDINFAIDFAFETGTI